MAFDEYTANRIRELLSGENAEEKPMFGGLAFLVGGHMAVAVSGQGGLLVRVPKEETATLSSRAHVSPMIMGGREITGWLRVAAEGVQTKRQLASWVNRGVSYARTLPAK